jgi:phosphatidylinositol kinase/protein kinase (PI-3  family)
MYILEFNITNISALTPKTPTIINKDSVPFRYTPNIQTFIGEVGLEGLFSCAIMAVARCLSEPEVPSSQVSLLTYSLRWINTCRYSLGMSL